MKPLKLLIVAGVGGAFARNNFNQLDPVQKADLLAFLNSL